MADEASADKPDSAKSLYDDVMQDLSDRKDWEDQRIAAREDRMLDTSKRRKPYPNAPDLPEPLIDDQISQVTQAELGMLWNARVLAIFVPMTPTGLEVKRQAEAMFDTLLKYQLKLYATIERLLDLKNEVGFAVAKMVEIDTPLGRLPSIEVPDPLDIIAPTATRRAKDADRITHCIRYTEREFRKEAQRKGWFNVEEVVKASKNRQGNQSSGRDGQGGDMRAKLGSLNLPSMATDEILIYEEYHYKEETPDEFRAWCTVYSPDIPDKVLTSYPWRWQDTQQQEQGIDPLTGAPVITIKTIPGEDRPWPFVQERYENRGDGWYDTRGIGKKLKRDQAEATAYRNAKAVLVDYTCKPFLKGNPSKAAAFRWRPGESLPDGVEVVFPAAQGFPQVFDYSTDQARANATRRVASPMGSLSSTSRKGQAKTATEVSATLNTFNQFQGVAVERFTEPLAELFNMMWEFLQHNPVDLPAMIDGQGGMVSKQIFSQPFLIQCGAAAKTFNPEFMLQYLEVLGQFLAMFPAAAQFVRGDEVARMAFQTLDPKVAERVVVDPKMAGPNGTAPIEQQVAMLVQQSQAQAQYLTQIAQNEQAEAQTGGENEMVPQQGTRAAPATSTRTAAGGGMPGMVGARPGGMA